MHLVPPTPPDPLFTPAASDRMARLAREITVAFRPFVTAVNKAARALGRLAEQMREHANDPVRVAGLTARYHVRGALDPAYDTPEGRDALVRAILAGYVEDDPLAPFLSRENRRACAVAAMQGWASRHPGVDPVVLHRLWGSERIEVRCG